MRLLHSPLKYRFSTKSYTIYIDETISFKSSYDKFNNLTSKPDHFMTAFWVINSQNIRKFEQIYKNKVYRHSSIREYKSVNVSDRKNKELLLIGKEFTEFAYIFDRKNFDPSENSNKSPEFKLALEIFSYLSPLQKITTSILKYNPKTNLHFNVVLDATSYMKNLTTKQYNQQFLLLLEQQFSTPSQKITFSLTEEDSRKFYGIQVADMLAGAYRKQQKYFSQGETHPLIPFSYQESQLNHELIKSPNFLAAFGLANIALSPSEKAEASSIRSRKQKLSLPHLFSKPHTSSTYIDELEKLRTKINQFIKNTPDQSQRLKIIKYFHKLNNKLLEFNNSDSSLKLTLITNLSKKDSTPAFNKTCKNIVRNLNMIKKESFSSEQEKQLRKLFVSYNKKI